MNPDELTQLMDYHTKLHEDAVTSGNPTLAAYHAAMAAAFQMARGPWVVKPLEEKKKSVDPVVAQLAEMSKQLGALMEALQHD